MTDKIVGLRELYDETIKKGRLLRPRRLPNETIPIAVSWETAQALSKLKKHSFRCKGASASCRRLKCDSYNVVIRKLLKRYEK